MWWCNGVLGTYSALQRGEIHEEEIAKPGFVDGFYCGKFGGDDVFVERGEVGGIVRGKGVGIGVPDVVDADPDGDEGLGGVHGDNWLCVGGP
ncbi:hypothetical protein BPOR_0757g00040 [Botrytis porri]|uniref:Uncharacterized protein n=1 Tax=Botrytis porri TaxID=87229 RepID=A0A4Z1K9W5_9HELO|nr:hypothetical protein BPOR_0757g00040 [Botrytis porri]